MDDAKIREQYNAARKDAVDRDARIHAQPVSKKEQVAREKLRAKPQLEQTLTPTGAVVQEVNKAVESENERRIHFIKQRLNRQRGVLKPDFDREL